VARIAHLHRNPTRSSDLVTVVLDIQTVGDQIAL